MRFCLVESVYRRPAIPVSDFPFNQFEQIAKRIRGTFRINGVALFARRSTLYRNWDEIPINSCEPTNRSPISPDDCSLFLSFSLSLSASANKPFLPLNRELSPVIAGRATGTWLGFNTASLWEPHRGRDRAPEKFHFRYLSSDPQLARDSLRNVRRFRKLILRFL